MTEPLTDELIDAALMAAMDAFQSGAKSMYVDLVWKSNPAAFEARRPLIEALGEQYSSRIARAAYADRAVYELFRERVIARLTGHEPSLTTGAIDVEYRRD